MEAKRTLFRHGVQMAAAGCVVWFLLLVGTALHWFRLSIFELLFLLAPWIVVPLALRLVPASGAGWIARQSGNAIRYLSAAGAVLITISFFLRQGRTAGALTCIWLVVALALAADGLARLVRTRLQSFADFCSACGEGYALIGALWLLASRLGLRPLGFDEPIVLLTAIHFHYAGLMAAVLAGLAASGIGATRAPLALRVALSSGVIGPGLLGLAFLAGPRMKLAAVGLLVIGECGIAVGTFRIGYAQAKKIGGALLLVGSACVIFGMALAVVWAVGEYPLHAFVNLEQMARYHGVLNGMGFGLCSLIGWILLCRNPQPALERR